MIINITGGPDLTLAEVSEASEIIQDAAHEEANIIFGAVVDREDERQGEDHGHRDRASIAPAMAVGPAAQSETPVDLGAYTSWRQTQDQRVAATAGGSRVAIARRPMIELPVQVQAPLESDAAAAAPGRRVRAAGRAGLPAPPDGGIA